MISESVGGMWSWVRRGGVAGRKRERMLCGAWDGKDGWGAGGGGWVTWDDWDNPMFCVV